MNVRIQLLGPLRAWRDGDELELGGQQQRAVLGLLATAAASGTAVSLSELIDTVWPEYPPASGSNVIQTYLKRLRRLLEPDRSPHAPSRFLRRTAGGYALHLSDMDLDLLAFRRLVSAADDAERAGDQQGTARQLGEALQLWKDAPLANVPLIGNHPTVVALAGQRWATVARYGEAMLAIGEAAKALSTLEHAAAACPLDEAAHARLIRTYHRVGDRSRAFATYHAIRSRLADELGVGPGPELAAAHLELLKDHPPPDITESEPTGARPAQLPATTAAFVGRGEQLRQLDKLRSVQPTTQAVTIAAIVGVAGVGKTTLAVQWARQVADEFPDGQLFVNLRGFDRSGQQMSPGEALRGFLEALDVPPSRIPTSLDAQAGRYRSLVAGRRMLIVLDNARDADQVRPLLPGSPGCFVLVTSRNQLAGLVSEAAQPLSVDLLSADEARILLTHRLGADRIATQPQATDDILTHCAGLPLALAIVAARAAAQPRFPLQALAQELHQTAGGLDGFTTGEPATDLRAVFSWSYRALSLDAQRLFRLLAIHPGPDLTVPAVTSLTGVPAGQARPLLAELIRAHLLNEPTPGRYTLHDLLRTYATELVRSPHGDPERQAAVRRLLDHYLHTARAAALLLDPSRVPITLDRPQAGVTPEPLAEPAPAKKWFDDEHPGLRAVIGLAAETGHDRHASQLVWSLTGYLDWCGRWHDNLAVHRIALDAAARVDDRPALARTHHNLACVLARLERLDEAAPYFQRALELFDELQDPLGQASVHSNLAIFYRHAQLHERSLPHQQQALELFQKVGNKIGCARTLSSMAWTHSFLGDHHQGLACSKRAISLQTELSDRWGQGAAWAHHGFAHHHLGDHAKALDSYQRALHLFQDIGERQQEADTLAHIGDTHLVLGDTDHARAAWRRALTILDELGHPDADQVRTKLATAAG